MAKEDIKYLAWFIFLLIIFTVLTVHAGELERICEQAETKYEAPSMTAEATWVQGTPTLAPDGHYVGGNVVTLPDGTYTGDGSDTNK